MEANIKNGTYQSRFEQVLARNFNTDYALEDRRFDQVYYFDQYKQKHILPFFISKITPPDSNSVLQGNNSEFQSQRGIRTMSEVANFVRCIPFRG